MKFEYAILQTFKYVSIPIPLLNFYFAFCVTISFFGQSTMAQEKLKILCLHGYQQNAQLLREKTGGIRKAIKTVEWHFIDSPHRVENSTDDEKDPRGWWFTNENRTYSRSESDLDVGFQDSLEAIENKYTKDGPYHGLLGFSQGGSMAAIIAALDQQKSKRRFQFIMLVSGLKSHIKSHSKFYENIIDIPSLHVMGEADTLVDKGKSEELAECFNPTIREVYVHKKAHLIPCDKTAITVYRNFIQKFSNST
ncbi:esterase OVCA2 [Planococcus citri]|uniref:esterase OVCA2 n=1 Tax=Planococcus citri TaxID=170843 RepID=UPI0031F90C54